MDRWLRPITTQDGVLALAIAGAATFSKGGVAILHGNGDGTFGEPELHAVGPGAQFLTSGDLNGDGLLDLVVGLYPSNMIAVLLNNGNGTFQPVVHYLLPAQVGWVALADTNADGNLDLLTGLSNHTVAVLFGDGLGGFQPARTIIAGDFGPPALSDFNGDGLLDVSLPEPVTGLAVVLGDGNGTSFVAPAVFSTGGRSVAIAVVDLDGDGYPDLVAASGLEIDVLLNAGAALPVTISPTSLIFPAQNVGTTSKPQSFKLTNTGASDLTISSVTVSGDFLVKNTCASTIAPSGSCNINLQFRPRAPGTRKGVVTITDSAASSPQKVQMTGTGQ